jgi:hypothetical protein
MQNYKIYTDVSYICFTGGYSPQIVGVAVLFEIRILFGVAEHRHITGHIGHTKCFKKKTISDNKY